MWPCFWDNPSPLRPTSPLLAHACALRRASQGKHELPQLVYPMYTVRQETFLTFSTMRPHEELLSEQVLELFCGQGIAIFVSHQWVGTKHPDPQMKHLGATAGGFEEDASA
ncbi:unnamed protein product [Durusdinium trenchii]|uniref:Uncharacterized protein n=2 Tax=Durusdinium trenchii TaxID=1381693 RepID=A0ABP0PV84_9DINO